MAAKRRKEKGQEPARKAGSNSAPVRRANLPAGKATAKDVAAAFASAKSLTGTTRLLGDQRATEKVEVISTGSVGLDHATGIGGMPRGRIVEVYGPESGGKTTLTLQVVAKCQQAGGVAVFIDAEHALDPTYCRQLGINVDELVFQQPDNGEQGLEAVELAVMNGADLVVVDSVAALVPKAEIEGDYGDSLPGLQARLMSQGLRKLTGLVGKSRCCVIFINQIREKIGVMFGNPETTTGGRALKFYASMRLDVRRIGAAAAGKDEGNRVRVKCVKNKLGPPFREAEFEVLFGKGIDTAGELLDIGVAAGLVKQAGSWYAYDGTKLGMGGSNASIHLREHPEVMEKLRLAVKEVLERKAEPEAEEEVSDGADPETAEE